MSHEHSYVEMSPGEVRLLCDMFFAAREKRIQQDMERFIEYRMSKPTTWGRLIFGPRQLQTREEAIKAWETEGDGFFTHKGIAEDRGYYWYNIAVQLHNSARLAVPGTTMKIAAEHASFLYRYR